MSDTVPTTVAVRTDTASAPSTVMRRLLRQPVTLVSGVFLLVLAMVAVFAPVLTPHDPLEQSMLRLNLPPSADYWLGSDQFGRDIFSRLLAGTRASLLLGVLSPLLAAAVGCTIGVVAGYFGGVVDRLASQAIDLLLAFPALLLGILVSAALGPGFWELVGALVLAFAPRFARIARASTLSVRGELYVEAAVAAGVRHHVIIARHVIPNIAGPVIVVLTLWIATSIRLEATLSFLGLGTQVPNPSWGNIIRDGLANLFGSPWPIVSAGLAITLTVLAFNLIGDAVRDALDPEMRV